MTEHLSGIEARDKGIVDLCEAIAPEGYRVVIPPTATAIEDLGAHLTDGGDPVDDDGTPLWIYGSTLPRALIDRYTKVQVHEPFDDAEVPAWFDHRFPEYVRTATLPGYSCFSPGSLAAAAEHMLGEHVRVRLKDPNGASGVGQSTIGTVGEIAPTLDAIASDVTASHAVDLAGYLARYGYVVEAEIDDVEAWSVTLTRTPDGHYSSFGRLRETTVDTADRGVIQNYGGTSLVVVRGDPEALTCVPAGGAVVYDPAIDEDIRLAPSPGVIEAAQCYIEGMRLWEAEGALTTRANVDVVTGRIAGRDGSHREIAAAVEDSGRVGGASPAELLGIEALRADPTLSYVVRSSRHGFDDVARTYARYAATVPGSRTFWNGADPAWDDKYVFIGAF